MTTIRYCTLDDSATRALLVLTTWPADRDPELLARPLVEEGLAACVNVLPPMESLYWWEGAVQRDAERQIVMKTSAARLDDLHARVQQLHPYDVPEFLVFEIAAGGGTYLDWVAASTGRDPRATE